MTPRKAAKIIGCTPHHVRHLILHKKLKAKKRKAPTNQYGFYYDVLAVDARAYAADKRKSTN